MQIFGIFKVDILYIPESAQNLFAVFEFWPFFLLLSLNPQSFFLCVCLHNTCCCFFVVFFLNAITFVRFLAQICYFVLRDLFIITPKLICGGLFMIDT